MAKLSANKSYEIARLVNHRTREERSYRSDGRLLSKPEGGRWSLISSYAYLRGEDRWAWFATIIREARENGWDMTDSAVEIKRADALPGFAERVQRVSMKVRSHLLKKKAEQAARDEAYAAARPQREQEQREREQHADAAITLRSAAGMAIECPRCGKILDQSNTVHAVVGHTFSDETIITRHTRCGDCWDITEQALVGSGDPTVTDGRLIPAHVWRCSTEALVGYAMIANRKAGGAR